MITDYLTFPLTLNSITQKDLVNKQTFFYKLNSDGFRSDNFVKNPKLLFAGCSETFGECSELNSTWAYQTYQKINNKNEGFYNLGQQGISSSIIIFFILEFIKKYGKPENLFVIFPSLGRVHNITDTGPDLINIFLDDGTQTINPLIKNVNKDIRDLFYSNNFIQIKNFETLCKILNINFIWSTWCYDSSLFIEKNKKVNNYVNIIDSKKILEYCNLNNIKVTKNKLKRVDGIHHGEIFHKYWSHVFYTKYLSMIS